MSARRGACMRLTTAVALVVVVGTACGGQADREETFAVAEPPMRLEARSRANAQHCAPGVYDLRISPHRRALMRVTPPARQRPRALLVALHGAGSGGAPGGLWAFRGAWRVPGLVIVAPAAAGSAWTLGATDVGFVDRALQRAFALCQTDQRRVAIGGFSSGAGMALWLGLANGDLFRGIIALSGGSSLPNARVGKPRVFVAHGTLDNVIPVELGGDVVVRELRDLGYGVTYRRFRGGHRVVPSIARAAVTTTVTS